MDKLLLEIIELLDRMEAIAIVERDDVARGYAVRTREETMWLYKELTEYKV